MSSVDILLSGQQILVLTSTQRDLLIRENNIESETMSSVDKLLSGQQILLLTSTQGCNCILDLYVV